MTRPFHTKYFSVFRPDYFSVFLSEIFHHLSAQIISCGESVIRIYCFYTQLKTFDKKGEDYETSYEKRRP